MTRRPAPVARSDDLNAVKRFAVPRDIVDAVQEELRRAGHLHCEGVGFWAGRIVGNVATVMASIVPAQNAGAMGGGLAVMVTGEELFRMNVWLHKNDLRLLAQLHSHPGDAYHSETDDELAVVTQAGTLSIVVPDFAKAPFSVTAAAVYRRASDGSWTSLSSDDASSLIHILED